MVRYGFTARLKCHKVDICAVSSGVEQLLYTEKAGGSNPSPRTCMEKEEIYCCVRGKVQGVTYRMFAAKHARHLALVGYVRNMRDFTVEVVAQGFSDNLEKFIEHLRKGSFGSHVSNVEVTWRELSGTFEGFEIQY